MNISWMSRRRQIFPLSRYSLSPERNSRRVTTISPALNWTGLDFRVDQRERHLGHAGWLAIPRADKDHIFHARAAQALGRLFAQHPGDGVGNIRLAAPIGPHNGGNAFAMEFQLGAVAKRLKSEDLQLLQSEHASSFVEWLGNTCNVPS